jgi:hypothetical protein
MLVCDKMDLIEGRKYAVPLLIKNVWIVLIVKDSTTRFLVKFYRIGANYYCTDHLKVFLRLFRVTGKIMTLQNIESYFQVSCSEILIFGIGFFSVVYTGMFLEF